MTGAGHSRRVVLPLALFLLCWGCVHSPQPYDQAFRAAEMARRNQDYERERSFFKEALKHASNKNEEAEARYRYAHVWLREGQLGKATSEFEALASELPHSNRAARSLLDAARTQEKMGRATAALRNYHQVLTLYPNSGGAISSAKNVVKLESRGMPKGTDIKIWKRLVEEGHEPSLDEGLRFQLARALEADFPLAAILEYEGVALRYPLPTGTRSDEALFQAAVLRRALGDFRGALLTLDLLVEQKGSAFLVGTYTRPSYINALYLKAIILRDDLADYPTSRIFFEQLVHRHPTSRLVDDALWQMALNAELAGTSPCKDLTRLSLEKPESRFVGCAFHLCPQLSGNADKSKDYCSRLVESSKHYH